MKAIEIELEQTVISALREVSTLPVTGFFAEALEGEMKTQDATSVNVTVQPRVQVYEPHGVYTMQVEIRLSVESCESKGGGLFVDEFDAIAGLLEKWADGTGCDALSTERFDVGGLQQSQGGGLDFDPTAKIWFASWNCTVTGCIN